MSKVGKLPVAIPAGVTVNVANGLISVKGPKGELKQSFHDEIDIKVEGTEVVLPIETTPCSQLSTLPESYTPTWTWTPFPINTKGSRRSLVFCNI